MLYTGTTAGYGWVDRDTSPFVQQSIVVLRAHKTKFSPKTKKKRVWTVRYTLSPSRDRHDFTHRQYLPGDKIKLKPAWYNATTSDILGCLYWFAGTVALLSRGKKADLQQGAAPRRLRREETPPSFYLST